MYSENELSRIAIYHAINVHKTLGPGLLESVYESCLIHRLTKAGLYIYREYPIPIVYEQIKLDCGYRADIIIENKLIIEIKSVDTLSEIHKAQLLTYLRLTNLKLGLLINFNVIMLREGIKRVANGL